MKKIAAVLVMAALALTGCGEPPRESDRANTQGSYNGSDFDEVKVKLSDGRTVLCLSGTYRLNCDWEHAK